MWYRLDESQNAGFNLVSKEVCYEDFPIRKLTGGKPTETPHPFILS